MTAPSLGRLKSFGLTLPEHIPLLLPERWEDLRLCVDDFRALGSAPGHVLVRARVIEPGSTHLSPGRPPRWRFGVADSQGLRLSVNVWGASDELQAATKNVGGDLLWWLEIDHFNGQPCGKNAELVDGRWLGRLRPWYRGVRRRITPELARALLTNALPSQFQPAAVHVLGNILDGAPPEHADRLRQIATRIIYRLGLNQAPPRPADLPTALAEVLQTAHWPDSIEEGRRAQTCVEYLSALNTYRHALLTPESNGRAARVFGGDHWRSRASALPFPLAPDQRQAVQAIVDDFSTGRAQRRILCGETGSGKTATFCVAIAHVLDAGGRVAVMCPSTVLARQVAAEFRQFFPDLAARSALLAGRAATEDPDSDVVFGTTKVLHLLKGPRDFVVVDEQQRFSRGQREKLLSPHSHLLECSATPIPRSECLVRFGIVDVSYLASTHVQKTIDTHLFNADDRATLFARVQATLASGGQVAVVYPARSKGLKEDSLPSAEEAFEKWARRFPGACVLAHGGLDDDSNGAALDALRAGTHQILIATTVIETGIDLPNLQHIVVVHPERFGLTTLHQLRGRVARKGGHGLCDLFLPRSVNEDAVERLNILVAVKDGFEIARHDLAIRGFGDLTRDSKQQHGSDGLTLFGRPIVPERLETVARVAAE